MSERSGLRAASLMGDVGRGDGVGPVAVGRRVLGIWRPNAARFLFLGAVIIVPVFLFEALTDQLAVLRSVPFPLAGVAAVVGVAVFGVAGAAWTVVGEALYAGIVEHLAYEDHLGGPAPPLGTVVRSLPLGRLVLVSLFLGAVVAVGLILLVIPGLVALTWFSVASPLVSLRRHNVRSAMRESARLVRGHFWRVFTVVTIVVVMFAAADQIGVGIHAAHAPHWVELAFEALVEIVFASLAGVTMVVLLHSLLQMRRGRHDEDRRSITPANPPTPNQDHDPPKT